MLFSGLMNPESRVGRICGFLANMIIVNLCFVLTLIPVITAGAGIAAMYYAMMKMIRQHEIRPVKDFWKGFSENFKRATLIWIILIALTVILFLDFRIVAFMGAWAHGLWIGLAGVVLIILTMAMYLFPIMACFYGTLKEQIRNSILFIGKNIFTAAAVFCLNTIPMYLTYRFAVYLPLFAFLWTMIGFALITFLNANMLLNLFIPYLTPVPEQEKTSQGKERS
jgi:uncharacterized membrane protein YesL